MILVIPFSKTTIKDTVGPMTDDLGDVILDDGVSVKLLNECFASINTKENLVDMPMYNKASYMNALNTVDFTEETVYDTPCLSSGPTNLLVLMEYIQLRQQSCNCYFQTIESHFLPKPLMIGS